LAACAVIISLTLASCYGGTRIDGVVKDSAGTPALDAQITLTEGGRTTQAQLSPDGRFTVALTHAPSNVELKLSAVKNGYEPFNKTFSSSTHLQPIVITLQEMQEPSLDEIRRSRTNVQEVQPIFPNSDTLLNVPYIWKPTFKMIWLADVSAGIGP
jgi:hypothetical protein